MAAAAASRAWKFPSTAALRGILPWAARAGPTPGRRVPAARSRSSAARWMTAVTKYIASYTAPNGHYSVTRNYFTPLGVDNGPLHGVASGAAGANGVYIYAPGSMPTLSYQASNYWVDVEFNAAIAADTMAPT